MMKILTIGMLSLVAFAMALGAGWFLQQSKSSTNPLEPAGTNPSSLSIVEPASGEALQIEIDLPLAVRPRPMSPEEILQFGLGLREREEALLLREKEYQSRQDRLALVFSDLQAEQLEIEGLRAEIRELLRSGSELQTELRRQQSTLQAERAQLEADQQVRQAAAPTTSSQNVRPIAQWVQGMEPATAASFLKTLANDGKIDMAVEIMSQMSERETTKILEALDDHVLMVQLAERFAQRAPPPAAPSRR